MMAAFPKGGAARRAQGAHDPLMAKVLVLADEQTSVALCCCDVAALRSVDVARIRRSVAERVPDLTGARCTIAASHTHSGPETMYLFGNTPDDPWIIDMDRRIGDAVVRAHESLAPCTARLARGEAPLNFNRRAIGEDGRARMVLEHREGVTGGVSDSELIVLRFDAADGSPLAVVHNYAAHALAAGPENMLFTADFPGVAGAVIERNLAGASALFLNGGAGNVHPRECMRADFAAAEKIGSALGEAVLKLAASPTKELVPPMLQFASTALRFANRVDPALQVEAEVSCLCLGPLAIGCMPGEPFVEFQLRFKRALFPRPGVLVGYANGWQGYIPTREAYEFGGYGVDLCTTDPAHYSRTALPPGAGEAMLDWLIAHSGG